MPTQTGEPPKTAHRGPPLNSSARQANLACTCGATLTRARRRLHQVISCPNCGNDLFVLPASPFPPPTQPPREDFDSEGEEVTSDSGMTRTATDDVINAEAITAQEIEHAHARPSASTSEAEAAPVLPIDAATDEIALPEEPESTQPSRVQGRPWWRRPKILLTLAAGLLLASILWTLRSQHRQSLAHELPELSRRGKQAYDNGDFATAKKELERAVTILRRLGPSRQDVREFLAEGKDADDVGLEQIYFEAAICNDLLTISLAEIAQQAHEKTQRASPEAWQRYFRANYRGKALVIDAVITPTGSGDPASFSLEYLLRVENQSFRLDGAPLHLFQKINAAQPRRLIFGARLDSMEPAPDAQGDWLILLEPESGVLFTELRTLEYLGWTDDDALDPDGDLKSTVQFQRTEVARWRQAE